MKLTIHVTGGSISHFPPLSEFRRQGVEVEAKRTGTESVRWTLTASWGALKPYAGIARRHNLRYSLGACEVS